MFVFVKSKAILSVAALLMSCSFATQASAVGESYEFSANNSRSYWNLNAYSPGAERPYYLDTPSFEFDPSESFRAANETVTGHFSYNTDAPLDYTTSRDDWSYSAYDSEAFALDLVSTGDQSRRFDFTRPRAALSTYTDPVRRYFFASGSQVEPPITLTGDGEPGGCGEEFCGEFFLTELPVDQLRQDNPELFAGVEFIEVRLFGLDVSAPYDLSSANYGFRHDTLLSGDGLLPESLPTLDEAGNSWVSLHFNPQFGGLGLDVDYIAGDISEEQEQQIFDFVGGLYVDLGLSVQYDVTELTQLGEGMTPHNPILPNNPDGNPEDGFNFTFDVPENPGEFTFIDPDVAVGYDYEVMGGASFSAVLLPEDIGDNLFDLWLFDGTDFVDSGIDLTGGVPYTFDPEVDQFRILGIETSEFLDPDDPTAFVTGLQFLTQVGTQSITMSQTPIIESVDVPTPTSGVFLLVAGITGMFTHRRNAGRE